MPEANHYQTLGVLRDARQEDIQTAYNRKLRRLRDKIGQGTAPPPEYMDELRVAWQVLRDPVQRQRYDALLPPDPARHFPDPATLLAKREAGTLPPFSPAFPPAGSPPAGTVRPAGRIAGEDAAFEFVGNGGEYFRIWIVNLLLTVLTLGIYSAWAKVRREQYFHRNLLLGGSGFDYHGTPAAILKGRAIAFTLFILLSAAQSINPLLYLAGVVVLVPLVPWLAVRAFRFRAHNTSYRGLHFSFHGTYRQALVTLVGYGLLTVLSFGLLFPLFYREQRRFVLNNLRYGTAPFQFEMAAGILYRLFLLPFLLLLAFPVAVGALFASQPGWEAIFILLPLLGIGFFVLQLLVFAYIRVGLLNLVWNGTTLASPATNAPQHHFVSHLKTLDYMKLVVINWLLTILTLGLFWPWAQVRMARYRAAQTLLVMKGSLDDFVAGESRNASAVGDETAEMFDLDIAL